MRTTCTTLTLLRKSVPHLVHAHIREEHCMNAKGRVTLPIEQGMDDQLPGILARLGADAVRNSDGTWLPEITPSSG